MSSFPEPLRCGHYIPGHKPHFVQVLHSNRDVENPSRPGRLLYVDADGTIKVEVEGDVLLLWNHEPLRLEQAARRNDGAVSLQWPRWHLLRVESDDGWHVFDVADPDTADRNACRDGPERSRAPFGAVGPLDLRGMGEDELRQLADKILDEILGSEPVPSEPAAQTPEADHR